MNPKKLFCSKVFILVVCLILLIFTVGCGGTDNPSSDTGETSSSSQASNNKDASAKTEPSLTDLLAKGKNVQGISFETSFQSPDSDSKVPIKVWMKGNNMRCEMNDANTGNIVMILNMENSTAYTILEKQNIATKIDLSSASQQIPKDPRNNLNQENMKYLGKDTIDGKKCLIYEVSHQGGVSKTWIWEEYGFPIRVETTTDKDEQMVIEYKNIQVKNIPDSMFELPANVKVMSM